MRAASPVARGIETEGWGGAVSHRCPSAGAELKGRGVGARPGGCAPEMAAAAGRGGLRQAAAWQVVARVGGSVRARRGIWLSGVPPAAAGGASPVKR